MDRLEFYIECIAKNNSLESYDVDIYEVLSEIDVTEAEDERLKEIILNLLQFCEEKQLSKYYIYLSCLANSNQIMLQKFVEYDMAKADLKEISETEIFEYVVYKRKHWFLKVLDEFDTLGKRYLNDNIYQKIVATKLIEQTNIPIIDKGNVESILHLLSLNDDEFVCFYKEEIKNVLSVITFLEDLSLIHDTTDEMFRFIICNSLLATLSKYTELEDTKHWERIVEKLQDNDAQLHESAEDTTQTDVFLSFAILCTFLNFITSNCTLGNELQKLKENFFKITSTKLQMEVIKIVFIFVFLRKEHLKHSVECDLNEYLNNSKNLNLIFQFLKDVFCTIKIENKLSKESPEYGAFTKFNKYLTDAIWRYELITHVQSSKLATSPHRLIYYMLAPPESLIHLCLKRRDFERADQVVKIFNLENTYLAEEIEYCVSYTNLKESYKKKQDLLKVIEFLQKPSPIYEETNEKDLIPLCLQKENDRFMNMFDFAVTQCTGYDDSKAMLDEAFKYCNFDKDSDFCYSTFCNKFKTFFEIVGKKSNLAARNVLTSANFELNIEHYQREGEFFEQLENLYNKFEDDLLVVTSGTLNNSHELHGTYAKIRELCEHYTDAPLTSESRCYLGRLFSYLKAFSKVLYIQQNNSALVAKNKNCSLFEILHHNRALLVGKLLFENNLDPADFEEAFTKLKLDLLYHIAGNCFPTINLHKQEIVSSEELYPENRLYVPTDSIMTYVQKRNWLLAFILSEMYRVHALNVDVDKSRIRHFANYMNLPRIQHLKVLFEGSELITALQNEIDSEKLTSFIQKRMENDTANMATSCSSEDSVENAEEVSEEHMKAIDWKYLYDIVNSIPENQLRKSSDYLNLRDLIVKSMVSELYEFKYFEHVQDICNRQLRIETVLGSFETWPVDFCIKLLTTEVSKMESYDFEQKIVESWIEKLELYKVIMGIVQQESWYEIHKMCHESPEEVIRLVTKTKNIDHLQQFLKIFGATINNLENFVDAMYLAGVLELNEPFTKIKEVLNMLPTSIAADVCYNLLKLLKNIMHHQNVVAYLLKISDSESEILKNVQISLKILSNFPQEEQDQIWCLITSPLSILEVLVMNTKLDRLGVVLEAIKADLKNNENEENVISTHNVDEMLRSYAEKSLDFRVVLHSTFTSEGKLLQSFDSATIHPERNKFVMPAKVPDKEEWISNHEVTVCMCCSKTNFSMFNRRHHCRRCGRVVCHSCSQKRMLVETYGDILVRVCTSCFEQTQNSNKTESVSSKSFPCDFWLLTDNEEHNKIVREEFSYEHAPSVSLCLSILKHHSKTTEYPQFLLKQCEDMLKLLHPRTEATHEIDHLLVIRMLKSLALAAKMSCSECMLHWGISLADKILSQADLLHLLVERGCLGLLPVSNQCETIFIDTTVLRKLRDKLLEDEQWNLALEVSTKTGLDNTGVFAAWGKSCLKAGSLQLAREKFQRCLLKAPFDATSELESSFSVGKRLRTTSSSASSAENRPKDPPLLYEIIQILETKTIPIHKNVLKKMDSGKMLSASTFSLNQLGFNLPSDAAICILNKLKNLDAIAAGNYYEEEADENKVLNFTPRIQPIFYEECIFYLQKYGSPYSLLRFFTKHNDFNAALKYVLDAKIAPDIFTEIYIICLKDGLIDKLHACMREMDTSLDIWKDYFMNICRTLEKQHKLHSLYQLQLFLGDCIRAAMTCILFYQENTRSFIELVQREHYLQQAEMHFNQNLEQQQWVDVAAVSRSVGSIDSFEEKSITNPSLVMKMSSKTVGKHVNTIWRQIELARFLSSCEMAERWKPDFLTEFLCAPEGEESKLKQELKCFPTLFDSVQEKTKLLVLALISGKTISEGFEIVQKFIPEFKLKPMKIYCMAGKELAKFERYANIAELVTCIRGSSSDEKAVNEMCDEMLSFAVRALTNASAPGSEMEGLIKLISDKGTKISAYIEARQLKSAYFLAVKYKRIPDIRRIMREAELLNQPSIKSLCQKFIQTHSHSVTSQ